MGKITYFSKKIMALTLSIMILFSSCLISSVYAIESTTTITNLVVDLDGETITGTVEAGDSETVTGVNVYLGEYDSTTNSDPKDTLVIGGDKSFSYTATENGTYYFYPVITEVDEVNSASISINSFLSVESVVKSTDEWTKESVTLTVNATNAVSYSFDDGVTWQEGNTKSYDSNTSGISVQVKNTVGTIVSYSDTINITNIDTTVPTGTATVSPTEPTKGDVTITVIPSDDDSGIASVTSDDALESGTVDYTFTATANGTYTFTITDKVGNVNTEEVSVVVENIDKIAPAQPEVTINPTDLTKGDVTITVTNVYDADDVVEYSMDKSDWNTYQVEGVTVAENTTVYFKVTDSVGNVSEVTEITVSNIDKTAPAQPVVTGNPTDWINEDVTLKVTNSYDAGDKVEYSTDNLTWNNYTEAGVTVSSNTTVYFKTTDSVGNISIITVVEVEYIDKTLPVFSDVDKSTGEGRENNQTTITGYVTDADSGIDELVISYTGKDDKVNSTTVTVKSDGSFTYTNNFNTTYTITATDNAGNTYTYGDIIVEYVDDVEPTIDNVTVDGKEISDTYYTNNSEGFKITVEASDTASEGYSGTPVVSIYEYTTETVINDNTSWTNIVEEVGEYAFIISAEGKYDITIRVTDLAGNVSELITLNAIYLDTTDPVFNYDYNANPTGEDVTISGEVEDSLSGVKSLTVSYTDIIEEVVDFDENNGEFEFTAEYNDTYTFVVTDNAGNTTITNITISNIDKTVPVIDTVTVDGEEIADTYYTNSENGFEIKVTAYDEKDDYYVYNDGVSTAEDDLTYYYTLDNTADSIVWEEFATGTDVQMFTITDEGTYYISVKVVDNVGNEEIQTLDTIYLDTTAPTGEIKAEVFTKTWDELLSTITFGLYSKETVEIELVDLEDDRSELSEVYWYMTANEYTDGETLNDNAEWIAVKDFSDSTLYTTLKDDKFIVYVKLVDNAGNVTYISSSGIIYDISLETDDTIVFVTGNDLDVDNEFDIVTDNTYYDDSVDVTVTVTDPSVDEIYIGSGIKYVSYVITNKDTNYTENGYLYENTNAQSDFTSTITEVISVDSAYFNSNNVEVAVTVEDYAGNVYTKTLELQIDITIPTIEVTYDNNVTDSEYDTYFDATRTATIVVTERNFDVNNTTVTVKGGDDEYTAEISEWITSKGTSANGDDTTHTLTIKYLDDGDYTFGITTTDLASNTDTGVDYDNSVAPTEFTIDLTDPVITVSYDNNTETGDDTYFNSTRTATITVTEHNFDVARFVSEIYSTNNSEVTTEISEYLADSNSWTTVGDVHTATVEFITDADITITAMSITDMASRSDDTADYGNSSAPTEFTIDLIDPEINISYDANNDNFVASYFDADSRTATITVTEHNFDSDYFEATFTSITKDGTKTELMWSDWTTNGDVHTATITFEAGYTYTVDDIAITDMAGRVDQGETYYFNNGGTTLCTSTNKFTVDNVDPTAAITVGNWDASIDGTIWDKFISTITFGLWSQNLVKVEITSDDDISGIYEVAQFRTDSEMTLEEVMAYTDWTVTSNDSLNYTVDPDERFIVYSRVTDNAGHVIYLSSDGIILDTTSPEAEKIAPEITISQPINDIYNSTTTVDIDVTVIDPMVGTSDVFSGLAQVTYTVTSLGQETQTYTYDFSKDAPTQGELVQTTSFVVPVDATLNNSNDVVITIYAIDNAGNESTDSVSIKIDNTLPTISVTYDNNSDDSDFDGFFNESRTATIVVTERNFDPTQTIVTVQNTDGSSVPSISAWSESIGSGNGDSTTYTATITYSSDGDYIFGITTTDLAANANNQTEAEIYGSSVYPTEFTIDKTDPTISVSYDNNEVLNEMYYSDIRTATIVITEHNFDSSRVIVSVVATDDGVAIDEPQISSWSTSGDTHTATIVYQSDAKYTFDIEYTDMAGNSIADYNMETFYVDTIAPVITITNIQNQSANNDSGNIGFVIESTDTNFDVFSPIVTVVIKDENNNYTVNEITVGEFTNITNGQIYTVENLEDDGVYTITCTAIDLAGNEFTQVFLEDENGELYASDYYNQEAIMVFSVNRDGSTYYLDEYTEEVLGKYYIQNVLDDIEIVEINVDTLTEYRITLNDVELVENEDYFVVEETDDNSWVTYTYTINKDLFENEGEYNIVVYSTDKSGNNAYSDVKYTSLNFVVDRTAPVVVISGLSDNGRYQVDTQTVTIIPTDDGGQLQDIIVFLVDDNGNAIETLLELSGDDFINALAEGNGSLTVEIGEGLFQNLRVICSDASTDENGDTNVFDTTIISVSVSSSAFMIFWANKTLRWSVIIGLLALVGFGIFFIVYKKKKKK